MSFCDLFEEYVAMALLGIWAVMLVTIQALTVDWAAAE